MKRVAVARARIAHETNTKNGPMDQTLLVNTFVIDFFGYRAAPRTPRERVRPAPSMLSYDSSKKYRRRAPPRETPSAPAEDQQPWKNSRKTHAASFFDVYACTPTHTRT